MFLSFADRNYLLQMIQLLLYVESSRHNRQLTYGSIPHGQNQRDLSVPRPYSRTKCPVSLWKRCKVDTFLSNSSQTQNKTNIDKRQRGRVILRRFLLYNKRSSFLAGSSTDTVHFCRRNASGHVRLVSERCAVAARRTAWCARHTG